MIAVNFYESWKRGVTVGFDVLDGCLYEFSFLRRPVGMLLVVVFIIGDL